MDTTITIAPGITIATVADLHINSTTGLFPPRLRLDDGMTVVQSPWQAKMWECWIDFWKLAGSHKTCELWIVLNGDIMDGWHHGTTQVITLNLADQHAMSIAALEPALSIADKVYIIRGTTVHVGKAAQNEEMIGREIKAVQTPGGCYSWWALDLDVCGGMSFAHHGSLGRLPWTKGNIANRLAVEIELAYYRQGKTPPAFAVRSHRHQYADSGTNSPVRVLFTPCWQGPTDYVHALEPGAQPHIGGIIFQQTGKDVAFQAKVYNSEAAWMN